MGIEGSVYNFKFGHVAIQLLDWDADITLVHERMNWQPEFEIAIDYNAHPVVKVYLDGSVYLAENDNEYAVMIKVRSVFTISDFGKDRLQNSGVAFLMDKTLAHCRSICAAKCLDENITLPVIPYFTFRRLVEIASVTVHKASVHALSHGSLISKESITALAGSEVITIDKLKVMILWFEVTSLNKKEIPVVSEGTTANINFNYDYERLTDIRWNMYLDFGMDIPGFAAIKVRSGYTMECADIVLFTESVLLPLIDDARKNCITAFKEQCSQYKLNFTGDLKLSEKVFKSISTTTIKQYYKSRKKSDKANKKLFEPGLSLTQGGNTKLIMKGTFMIMDEILFLNPAFNRAFNRALLAKSKLPEPIYYTVKNNCMEIENKAIQLNWMHTVLFLICLDIALQLCVSEHADRLQPVLEKNNFTPFRQQEYIKFGSELYQTFNKHRKQKGAHFSDLEERKDWASLIL